MSSEIEQHESVEVFVGVDVGKGTHHAVALDRKGKRLLDSALPNDESKTDARDAYIIAEAARSMPHTLRSMKLADNEVAEF
jgi:Transposase